MDYKKTHIRILTRDSFLAMAQTIQVSDYLMKKGVNVSIKALKTSGDIKLDAPLYQVAKELPGDQKSNDGKAFFTKELEDGLLNNQGDLAVHSLKDLPTKLPEGLMFASAIMPVETTDTIVTLKKIPEDPVDQADYLNSIIIGTSSLRRIAGLKRWLPDCRLVSIRGNLVTRFEKLLQNSTADALLLATAGIKRLYSFYKFWEKNHNDWKTLLDGATYDKVSSDYNRLVSIFKNELYFYELSPEIFPPAVSQGVLGTEIRSADYKNLSGLFDTDEILQKKIQLERKLLSGLEAGCHIPYGNHITSIMANKVNYYKINIFYARNFNPELETNEKNSFAYFGAERCVPDNYHDTNIVTLINEIKGSQYPVNLCGLNNQSFVDFLISRGFTVNHLPLIKISSNPVAPQLNDEYDIGIVVSKNSVDYFPEKMPKIGKWISVGSKTAVYLKKQKNINIIETPLISDGMSSARLAMELTNGQPSSVIWFGALNGNQNGIDLLKENKYRITVYEGYKTESVDCPPELTKDTNFLEQTSWWVFTSPSSARSYFEQNLYRKQHLISVIGNTTAEIFFNEGITPYHIATKSDLMVMASEISGINNQSTWKTKQWSLTNER